MPVWNKIHKTENEIIFTTESVNGLFLSEFIESDNYFVKGSMQLKRCSQDYFELSHSHLHLESVLLIQGIKTK